MQHIIHGHAICPPTGNAINDKPSHAPDGVDTFRLLHYFTSRTGGRTEYIQRDIALRLNMFRPTGATAYTQRKEGNDWKRRSLYEIVTTSIRAAG